MGPEAYVHTIRPARRLTRLPTRYAFTSEPLGILSPVPLEDPVNAYTLTQTFGRVQASEQHRCNKQWERSAATV